MIVPINDIGSPGVIKDIPAMQLAPGAWSDVNNVGFWGTYARRVRGHSLLIPVSVVPYYLLEAQLAEQYFWLYAGLRKVYGFLGTTSADITRAAGDYTGSVYDRWNGGNFNNTPFLNNGVDVPQMWDPISLSQPLQALPYWPSTYRAKVMRTFKTYMIALGITKASTLYPRMVKWSDSADPGYLPGSWDETDPTKAAGEVTLSEGADPLVDCMVLGDSNILYLEDTTWTQQLSGTETIFTFAKAFNMSGLLAQDCVQSFRSNHFAVTQDDLIVHDGITITSVADDRLRRWFFVNLDSSVFQITFTLIDRRNREIWVCFPMSGGGVCTTALVWNWFLGTWTIRDLPDIRAGASSIHSPTYVNDLWDGADTYDWDTESTQDWALPGNRVYAEVLLLAPADLSGVMQVDDSNSFAGTDFASYVERTGLSVVALSTDGKTVADPEIWKTLIAIHPRIKAPISAQFSIELGSQIVPEGTVTWNAAQTFTVGTDLKVDANPPVCGRFFAVRISHAGGVDWDLYGYDLDVVAGGQL